MYRFIRAAVLLRAGQLGCRNREITQGYIKVKY
jgi:hypothetical protein